MNTRQYEYEIRPLEESEQLTIYERNENNLIEVICSGGEAKSLQDYLSPVSQVEIINDDLGVTINSALQEEFETNDKITGLLEPLNYTVRPIGGEIIKETTHTPARKE